MASKKQRVDAAKKRDKRSKIAAIVGCLVLVAVGAYEGPKMLAMMNRKPPTPAAAPAPSTGGALPNVAAGTTQPSAHASGQLVDTDLPPQSTAGQLVSFSVFETKNPFAPQVSSTPPSNASASALTTANKPGADVPTVTATTATSPATAGAPASVVPSVAAPSAASPTPTTTTTTATQAQPTIALSVNGVVSHVSTDGTFPTGSPVFRLVSWTNGTAQIAIVGGSYQTGDATLTLHSGEPVTLENQTDGKRYRIELLSAR